MISRFFFFLLLLFVFAFRQTMSLELSLITLSKHHGSRPNHVTVSLTTHIKWVFFFFQQCHSVMLSLTTMSFSLFSFFLFFSQTMPLELSPITMSLPPPPFLTPPPIQWTPVLIFFSQSDMSHYIVSLMTLTEVCQSDLSLYSVSLITLA